MKKIYFDVINSVKGGSGKSTISLLLALFHSSEPDSATYIIDLDFRGTSLAMELKSYLFPEDQSGEYPDETPDAMDLPYINDLVEDYSGKKDCKIFAKIVATCPSENEGKTDIISLNTLVCLANPKIDMEMDELHNDLFENAVFRIVEMIYKRNYTNSTNNIHVILDMPPSYERHAERVLKHMLTDVESPLYKNAQKGEGIYSAFEPYYVNLYMISALSLSHVKQNIEYIKALFNNQVYSNALYQQILNNRFRVRFIGNDVTFLAQFLKDGITLVQDDIKKIIAGDFTGKGLSTFDVTRFGDDFVKNLKEFPMVKHMYFPFSADFGSTDDGRSRGKTLELPAETLSVMQEIKIEL